MSAEGAAAGNGLMGYPEPVSSRTESVWVEASGDKAVARRITLETAAWAAVGLLAAALRLFQLGLRPLSEDEATQALAAFRFVHGTISIAPSGTLPASFTGNVLGFFLLGASDVTARLLPMLAGVFLVLLPLGLRHRLGRGGALAAALLLAVSPSAVYFSRTLDGVVLVAACGLAAAVGLIHVFDTRKPGGLYLAAAAVGLGLTTGPGFLTVILLFAAFVLCSYVAGRRSKANSNWRELAAAWQDLQRQKGLLTRAVVVFFATFGLVATTFVLHPSGLGDAADLIGTWFQSFLPRSGLQPIIYPWLLLLRYEPLLLLLGLVGLAWTVLNRKWSALLGHSLLHNWLFGFWAVGAALIVLLQGAAPAGNVLLVAVPLALLAGLGIERAWRWIGGRLPWREAALVAGLALALGFFFYLQLVGYALADATSTVTFAGITVYNSSGFLLLAGLAVLLLVGLAVAAWAWRGPDSVIAGGWLAVTLALGGLGIKATWSLNVGHAADPRELMIAQATAPEVHKFVKEMESLSHDTSGDVHTLPVTVEADTGPVVAWYLRDFSKATVVTTLEAPPATAAAITLAKQNLPIGETFRGVGFPLRVSWTPWGLGSKALVRWLFFDDAGLPVVEQEVVVWVANP